MRYQPQIREAYLRMLRIPFVGMIPTFAFSTAISGDVVVACYFALGVAVLLYIPLFGLLFFETKNWIEVHEDGLKMVINNDRHELRWDDIEDIKISRDTLVITSLLDDEKRIINYLSKEAKQAIYKTFFDLVGFRPNKSSFNNSQPGYLNWEKKNDT